MEDGHEDVESEKEREKLSTTNKQNDKTNIVLPRGG